MENSTSRRSHSVDTSKSSSVSPGREQFKSSPTSEKDRSFSDKSSQHAMDFQTPKLPIHAVEEELMSSVAENSMLVVTGDTGSGKSTQLAQFLHRAGYRSIAVTQPRRVGATSVACRVVEEMDVELGRKVGYTVRFDDCTSSQTQVRFLTDGCLLRECLSSRTHSNYKQSHPRYDSHVPDTMLDYDVVVLDEAHERSVHTDVLFGLMRELARKRKRFKLIITSATLDTHKFCGYFDDCPSFHIPGRCYPVEVMHSKTTQRFYVQSSVDTALR
eukprot:787869_1